MLTIKSFFLSKNVYLQKKYMKKLLLTLFSASLMISSFAQVYYSNNFETDTDGLPPANMTIYNNDACNVNNPAIFTNGAWIVADDGDAQGQFAAAQSWTNPPCQVNDWLITSAINLASATSNVELQWKGRSFEGPAYPETYEVRVSTTNTAVGSFALLTTVTNELGTWNARTLSLSAYAGQTIYVAFRLISTDQSQLWIDDIEVTEPAQSLLSLESFSTNGVYHNIGGLYPATRGYDVLDFSKRGNYFYNAIVRNTGAQPADTLIFNTGIFSTVDFMGFVISDTVLLNPPLAAGETYNYQFDSLNVLYDILFPGEESFFIELSIPQYTNNQVLDAEEFFSFSVLEPFQAPFTSEFNVVTGTNLSFERTAYSWKALDNNNDGNTVQFRTFTDLQGYLDDYFALFPPNANNDILQSPEIALLANRTYEISAWARTGFGLTGALNVRLVNSAEQLISSLGNITLAAGDSTYSKFTFTYTTTAAQNGAKVNFLKTGTGLVALDLFEINLLPLSCADSPITATATTTPNYCGNSNGSINLTPSGGFGTLQYSWSNSQTTEDISNLGTGSYTVTITDSLLCTAQFTYNVAANNYTLATSVSTTPATTCVPSNGTATASVSNGVGTVNYAWSNSQNGATISNLSPATYSVTTTDANGCTGLASGVVADNTYSLNVTISTTDVTNCVTPNGTATVTSATGGVGTLNYAWSNSQGGISISTVSAGPSSGPVTDVNGCPGLGSGSRANTAGVNASFTSTNVSCNGGSNGSISVSASGGTAPITYEWSNEPGVQTAIASKNNLTAGNYTVIVRDAGGCQVILGPISVTQPNALAVSSSNVQNVSCNGLNNGSINLTISGGTTPYSYSWSNTTQASNSISNLQPGSYTLTVTDFNNCSFTSPAYTISQPDVLVLTADITNPLCNNDTNGSVALLATGGTSPYQYNNGGANQASNNFTGLAGGNFTYNVVDANGCTATTGQVSLVNPDVLSASLDGVNNVSCFGANDGSIDILVSGGTGAYTFAPAITDLASSTFVGLASTVAAFL
jgi:hypothetical protein